MLRPRDLASVTRDRHPLQIQTNLQDKLKKRTLPLSFANEQRGAWAWVTSIINHNQLTALAPSLAMLQSPVSDAKGARPATGSSFLRVYPPRIVSWAWGRFVTPRKRRGQHLERIFRVSKPCPVCVVTPMSVWRVGFVAYQ